MSLVNRADAMAPTLFPIGVMAAQMILDHLVEVQIFDREHGNPLR
jgi:hypothetical protein